MSHTPRFDLITRGGITAGEEWICDGDRPIARFEHIVVEQPEQNLRYFDRNARPVVLRDLCLAPGQRPLVAGVQLYWNLDGHIMTSELIDVTVNGRGSDRLLVTVVTEDPGGVARSRRAITVTRDDETGGYLYDFACHLELLAPETLDRPGTGAIRLEISDPWFCDVPAPAVDFDGAWSAQGYTHLYAETAADDPCGGTHGVWQMPLNHMATGIPAPQAFRDGGMLVLADDGAAAGPVACPAMEFVGATAARTGIGVCNWGYDIHLSAGYEREELYAPICERFRVRQCPETRLAGLRRHAAPIPPVEIAGHRELPRYERRSSFATPLQLDAPAGALDPWPWLPEGDGAEWCRDHGRGDEASLKIERHEAGVTEWTMTREGEGAWTQRWRAGDGVRVSVWVRTEQVTGRGACLGLRWIIFNHPERYPLRCSRHVTGTADWTQLTAEIRGPAPPEVSAVGLFLRLDGVGTAWFDDLDVDILGPGD